MKRTTAQRQTATHADCALARDERVDERQTGRVASRCAGHSGGQEGGARAQMRRATEPLTEGRERGPRCTALALVGAV